MAENARNNGGNGNNPNGGGSWWASVATGLVAAGSLFTAFAIQSRQTSSRPPSSDSASSQRNGTPSSGTRSNCPSDELVGRGDTLSHFQKSRRGVPRHKIPDNPVISNLNALLHDVYVRYVALKDDDFDMYYRVFTDVFRQIHKKMKEVDPYFERYSSNVAVAGSHYDRLRINKPDEFDVDIVIGLPLNMKEHRDNPKDSDIVLEPKDAGFVQLRMGTQYKQLMMRDGNAWQINKTAYEWSDDQIFLLRSKFSDWFKGVVDKALNSFNKGSTPTIYSGGEPYTIRKSESGPAKTLYIENISKGFKLDVDLVPALKFPESRWPITNSYREIRDDWKNPENYWIVVAKPNKNASNNSEISRHWRLGLHVQERKLMHDLQNLRQVIRLLKKLRDAQDMGKIASYYLKTLVLWEVVEREGEQNFWTQSPATLFKILVRKFYDALKAGKIPYFWNKRNNLIANINSRILAGYAAKLEKLLEVMDGTNSYKHVAKYLLTPSEFKEYNDKFLHI